MIHPTANIYDSTIGPQTKVAAFVEIGGSQIGRRCKIQAHAFLPPGTFIEDDVFIGPRVCFTNCRFPNTSVGFHSEPVIVKSGAVIGAGAVIGPGVTIGSHAMVALGAVLTRDIPAGHRYQGTPQAFTVDRWYKSQTDVGLPMTFDEWRNRYDELTYADQREFYQAVYEKFPRQNVGHANEVLRFVRQLPEAATILEIGGGDGEIARYVLKSTSVRQWYNYEICLSAISDGLKDARYDAVVPPDFIWKLDELVACDALIASHVLEHIQAAQVDQLLRQLQGNLSIYVESPLPEDSDSVNWTGRWNTHVLEIGWKQLEALFAAHGFDVEYRAPDIRWFSR